MSAGTRFWNSPPKPKILELPESVLECALSHDSLAAAGYFTERKLPELVAFKDARRIRQRSQQMIRELGEGVRGGQAPR